MKLPWRKILWVYRSADRGWVVSVFKRQWHVIIARIPDPTLSDIVVQALNRPEVRETMVRNNALIAKLMKANGRR
jgi:hypothetical protein